MPEPKFLWRAAVRRISRPIYLVAQNMPSAYAQVSKHPQVAPEDVTMMHRIDRWDHQENMTIVDWPEPPPEPDPDEPTPP